MWIEVQKTTGLQRNGAKAIHTYHIINIKCSWKQFYEVWKAIRPMIWLSSSFLKGLVVCQYRVRKNEVSDSFCHPSETREEWIWNNTVCQLLHNQSCFQLNTLEMLLSNQNYLCVGNLFGIVVYLYLYINKFLTFRSFHHSIILFPLFFDLFISWLSSSPIVNHIIGGSLKF